MSADLGTPGLPNGMSHLLVAEDALSAGRLGGSQVAVCGAQVDSATADTDDPGYCPECVAAALCWSTRSGAR